MHNPSFNTTLAGSLTGVPPFTFEGVTMNMFPLRANIRALTAFCDRYLNDQIPPEVAVFRPSLPYVQLGFINYGRMSPERGNVGWVSQNEVVFSIPLEWYRRESGKLVFVDWASLSPFIFVDDESSQLTGREVFGWPKVQGWLSRGEWHWQPGGYKTMAQLSTVVFSKLFAGERPVSRPLLEIGRWTAPRWSTLPPDFAWVGTQAMRSWMTAGLDLWEAWTRLPQRGYPAELDRATLGQKLAKLPSPARLLSHNPTFNTVNLKQFRDAERPELACYQALTNGRMTPARYSAVGLLGEENISLGDLSGGYDIRLYRYPSQPIASLLGLDAVAEVEGRDAASLLLKPVLPYWVELDLDYGVAETLCWRDRDGAWRPGVRSVSEGETANGCGDSTEPKPEAEDTASVPADPSSSTGSIPPGERPPAPESWFNTTRGGAMTAVTGPFEFQNVVLRVLPLLAKEERLQALLDEYLNESGEEPERVNEAFGRVEAWGRYVYMVANSFGPMASQTEDIGWWAHRAVWFVVPVKWYDEDGELITVATVPVAIYQDSDFATSVGREVNGWPALLARIESPPYLWLESPEAQAWPQDMLELETEMLPSLGIGQEGGIARLLTVTEADVLPAGDAQGWRRIDPSWADRLIRDHRAKVEAKRADDEFLAARAIALEVLANRRPLLHLALKQFRDGEKPLQACYQAIVQSGVVFDRVDEIHEIPRRLHVKIRRSPSQPLVESLGLEVKATEICQDGDGGPGGVVDVVQAIRPFWVNADLRTVDGVNVCSRAGGKAWRKGRKSDGHLLAGEYLDVGIELVKRLDCNLEARQRLHETARNWRREQPAEGGGALLSSALAAKAIERIEPQMIFESMLGHEWGNRVNMLWRKGREQKSDFAVDTLSLGPDAAREVFPAKATDHDRWFPRRVMIFHDPASETSCAGLEAARKQLERMPDLDLEIFETLPGLLSVYHLRLLIDANGGLDGVLSEEGRKEWRKRQDRSGSPTDADMSEEQPTEETAPMARIELRAIDRALAFAETLAQNPGWMKTPILVVFGAVELFEGGKWAVLEQDGVSAANVV